MHRKAQAGLSFRGTDVTVRAPLRLTFGGGGTDLESYYSQFGGFLIAGAIDKYIVLRVSVRGENLFRMEGDIAETSSSVKDVKHHLVRGALEAEWCGPPVTIVSRSDVPGGTGLGSSGAFTVALVRALHLAAGGDLDAAALAERASHVEIALAGEIAGKQDTYTAAYGGFQTYEFCRDGRVDVAPVPISSKTMDRLAGGLQLYFTGIRRSAGALLRDQVRRTHENDRAMLDNLHRTKALAYDGLSLLSAGEVEAYAELLDEQWQLKRRRSPRLVTPRLDYMYELATRGGAIGGKLVGAGGGGYMLVYSGDPERTRRTMTDAGFPELEFRMGVAGAHECELCAHL